MTSFAIRFSEPNHGSLQALYDACGTSFDHIINIVVLASEPKSKHPHNYLAYRQGSTGGPDLFGDWKFHLQQLVMRWITAFCYSRENPDYLKRLSPAHYELFKRADHHKPERGIPPFMRTVRMLLLLEALFLDHNLPATIQTVDSDETHEWRTWRRALQTEIQRIKNELSLLNPLIECLSGLQEPLRVGTTIWYVHVPLLICMAVAFSQSEYYPTPSWEAQSSLRARDEFERTCAEALSQGLPCFRNALDFVTLLIRYQSAVGQHVRATGGPRYLEEAEAFAIKRGLTPKVVLGALKLIAILEEARNHMLPGTNQQTRIGRMLLNDGVKRDWNAPDWYCLPKQRNGKLSEIANRIYRNEGSFRQDLSTNVNGETVDELVKKSQRTAKRAFERILRGGPVQDAPEFTWSYATHLELPHRDWITFRNYVEKHYQSLMSPKSDHPVGLFSFGLRQTRDLRPAIVQCIDNFVASKNPSRKEFRKYFSLRINEIPRDYLSSQEGEKELAIEIRLRNEIAGRYLLFPNEQSLEDTFLDGPSAADLLMSLFSFAEKRLSLQEDSLLDDEAKADVYVPVYLIGRILDIVGRLHRQDCLVVTLQFHNDGKGVVDETRTIYIPDGLNKKGHERLIRYIANYVNAVILNRAMSEGYRSCDTIFGGLDEADSELVMTEKDWRRTIEEAYYANGFDVLSDVYLRNYNTERKAVGFVERVQSGHLGSIAPSHAASCLKEWFEFQEKNSSESSDSKPVILGVDIGATLTKVRFYRPHNIPSPGASPAEEDYVLRPIGAKLSFQTPKLDPDAALNARNEKPATTFAKQLVRRIEDRASADLELKEYFSQGGFLLCVGVTWPGPVRAHHVAGTSTILANFPPLSQNIKNNKVEDMLDLDIVGNIEAALAESRYLVRERVPHAYLINDGEAAGYGTLAMYRSLPMKSLAVVKLGSGTASVGFDPEGKLWPGPWEGGKLVLDLGAKPRSSYPNGVANAFLSKRTLPALARRLALKLTRGKRDKDPFTVSGLGTMSNEMLDSQEIGLFLEAEKERDLLTECGLRGLAANQTKGSHEPAPIEVEDLRKAYENFEEIELSLQYRIQSWLGTSGSKAQVRLKRLVKTHGLIRLAQILGQSVQSVKNYFQGKKEPAIKARIEDFRKEIAKPAAEALGRYLGDFLVWLGTEHNLQWFVLSGGVLSGQTGKIAKENAIRRVAMYGFQLTRIGEEGILFQFTGPALSKRSKDSSPNEQDPSPNAASKRLDAENDSDVEGTTPADVRIAPERLDAENNSDDGTMGAASFAIAEFLVFQKQKGLQQLRGHLHRLAIGNTAVLDLDSVSFAETKIKEFSLGAYGLSRKEVEQFFASLPIVIQSAAGGDKTIFTRIPAERIA